MSQYEVLQEGVSIEGQSAEVGSTVEMNENDAADYVEQGKLKPVASENTASGSEEEAV